jgi:hypothetical protein
MVPFVFIVIVILMPIRAGPVMVVRATIPAPARIPAPPAQASAPACGLLDRVNGLDRGPQDRAAARPQASWRQQRTETNDALSALHWVEKGASVSGRAIARGDR